MHDPDTLEAFEGNLLAAFRAGRGQPWARGRDEPDVTWSISGVPWSWCNPVAGARFTPSNVDERIEAVLAPFRAARVRTGWWVTPRSAPADLAERLAAHGLEVDEPEPGMELDLHGWQSRGAPPGISVERVEDRPSFHRWCEIFVQVMGADPDGIGSYEERFSSISIGPDAPYRTYLAYKDGRAISTAFGVLSQGTIGIYGVTTLPEAARQGAGTAITAKVIGDAIDEGATRAILSASDEGFPVYERLGFRTVTEQVVARIRFDERASS